jgi:hypothetical protein
MRMVPSRLRRTSRTGSSGPRSSTKSVRPHRCAYIVVPSDRRKLAAPTVELLQRTRVARRSTKSVSGDAGVQLMPAASSSVSRYAKKSSLSVLPFISLSRRADVLERRYPCS